MTLRLHGYPVSNYHNAIHAALIEKGQPFEIAITVAAQDDAFLARSPMGKIPFLETPEGDLAETVAMLEYIEETVSGPSLLPSDPFERARVRQIINIVQVYVEAEMRQLFPGVFMGGVNSDLAFEQTRPRLERALRALARLARFQPFLAGERLSLADLFAFYTFDIARRLTDFVYGWRLLDDVPGLTDWYEMMSQREATRTVLATFAPAFQSYLELKKAAYREPQPRDALEQAANHA